MFVVGGARAAHDTGEFFDAKIMDHEIHDDRFADFELGGCLDLDAGD